MIKRHIYLLTSIIILLLLFGARGVYAQSQSFSLLDSKSLQASETLTYDVYFKLGIVRGKIGRAVIINKPITADQSYFSQVLFRTTGLGEMAFSTRDTLETRYSSKGLPLRYEHRGKEEGTPKVETISFSYPDSTVHANIQSMWDGRVNTDTTYTVMRNGAYVLDLVSTLALIRSIDRENLKTNTKQAIIRLPLGKSVVYGEIIYDRMDKAKLPSGQKVSAIHLILNIRDKAFDSSSNSIEVYLSNDDKLLPLMIRSKLKIGYAVCMLKDYEITKN